VVLEKKKKIESDNLEFSSIPSVTTCVVFLGWFWNPINVGVSTID